MENLIIAATPLPNPPGVSDSPDPQRGGATVTFQLTCSDSPNYVRGYICKDSACTNCLFGTYTGCWAYNVGNNPSNPTASYTLPSCCTGINVGANNYYGRCQSSAGEYTSITSVQTFTCKKEGSSTGACSCSSNTECFNYCSGWGYTDGTCSSSKCYDAHEGNQYSSTETRSCFQGTLLNDNNATGRYANVGGQLYYCRGADMSTSSYPYVFSVNSGGKVGKCYCTQTGNWDCSGVIPIRGGRVRIV